MEDREYSNIYAIPANYTDSGKILGGMLETGLSLQPSEKRKTAAGRAGYRANRWCRYGTETDLGCHHPRFLGAVGFHPCRKGGKLCTIVI